MKATNCRAIAPGARQARGPVLQHMASPKVLISDPISERGVDELSRDRALEVTVKTGLSERELVALIPWFGVLVVRSTTKITAAISNAGVKLRVASSARVGADKVAVETAT